MTLKPHSASECTNVFTLMPQGEIFHSIEGAVLCTMYIVYLPVRISWAGLCVFGTTFCSFGSDEVQKNVTCTGMMIIWSTLNEHSQHAKKDLSDGPGLMDSASHLPNQRGRQSECFGPVSLLLWWGWGGRISEGQYNRQLQKRERTGKEYGCFPFAWKTKIFKWKIN